MPVFKRILCPTDFSPRSRKALRYGFNLARKWRSIVHILHVLEGNKDHSEGNSLYQLNRIAATVDPRNEIAITTIKDVVEGRPERAIAEYADEHDIDLVVMGSQGSTGLAHLMMGSVARGVIREAPCPVLILGPNEGESTSLTHVAQVLFPKIQSMQDATGAESTPHNRDSSLDELLNFLIEELRLSAIRGMIILDVLEDRGWMKWIGERWEISHDVNLSAENDIPTLVTDNQGIELVLRGQKLAATDIHLDPWNDDECIIRMRIDGKLEEYCRMANGVADQMINQLKTLARMDIAEPFLPKEGRLRLPPDCDNLEVRMTSIPVAGGEAVALRLFAPEKIFFSLSELGFSKSALESVQAMLKLGEGVVLITGPTGSGKTTTVYSMLETLSGGDKNIVSIEDPVENVVPFVRQMNVDLKHGISMTSGLRTMLRMDPDIVFIGEIRDPEAALIGMRAASSGKYVLSTLHTRDIVSTITTLRDMGAEDRSMAHNLTGIINQRLVRRLCQKCKQSVEIMPAQRQEYLEAGLSPPTHLHQATGCEHCRHTGKRGRIGVFEVGLIHNQLADAIELGERQPTLLRLLRESGSPSLRSDGLIKAAEGTIDFKEAQSIHWLV